MRCCGCGHVDSGICRNVGDVFCTVRMDAFYKLHLIRQVCIVIGMCDFLASLTGPTYYSFPAALGTKRKEAMRRPPPLGLLLPSFPLGIACHIVLIAAKYGVPSVELSRGL